MAHIPLAILGHHVTQQVLTSGAKAVGKYALEQGVKYATKSVSSAATDRRRAMIENLKRHAESFQEIDTVPVKRRAVPCEEMDCSNDGYYDRTVFAYFSVPRDWSTAASPIFNLVQGDDIVNRRGRSVLVKKINLRFVFRVESQASSDALAYTNPSVRYIIYIDKFPNGVASTADMVQLSTGSASEPVDYFRNLLYTDRFFVLEDKTFAMNPVMFAKDAVGNYQSGNCTKVVHVELPLDVVTRYNAGNAGSVADCLENYFYVAVCSGSADALRQGFNVRCYCSGRTTFQSLSKY